MFRLTSCTVLLALAAAAAMAQDEDPPSRVARLNYLQGQVSFRPGSVDDWTAATLNYPLTTGDHLWADNGSRAELHVGSTAIRLSATTAVAVLNLDDRVVQLSLTQGSLNVHIRYLGADEAVEVDTPNVAISLVRPGDYRIDADGDQSVTYAVVRAGQAEAAGGGAQFVIQAGESASIAGMEQVTQEIAAAPQRDDFDTWTAGRDRRENSLASARYVPREMVGCEDLDTYGEWRYETSYGWVWAPTGAVGGWAPYHFGHWVWVAPWGWTWIDDAPWGFAPFHYGRWAFGAGGWFWVPGAMVVGVRPVYAPALVAFVGGPRFGAAIGIGGGGVAAWFPLGPGEVYRPAYRVSNVYVQNINIVHVTNVAVINNVNINNVRYVNQGVTGAVTAVPENVFVGARPVGRAAIIVPRGAMADSEIVGHAPVVAPTRESVETTRPAGFAPPPARVVSREVVARRTPPAGPVSFAAQEQALRNNGGRPLAAEQLNSYRTSGNQTPALTRSANAPPRMSSGSGPRTVTPRGGTINPGSQNANPPANVPPANNARPAYRTDRPGGQPVSQPAGNGSASPNVQNANPPASAPPASNPRPAYRYDRPPGNPPAPATPSGNAPGGGAASPGVQSTAPSNPRPAYRTDQPAGNPPAASSSGSGPGHGPGSQGTQNAKPPGKDQHPEHKNKPEPKQTQK